MQENNIKELPFEKIHVPRWSNVLINDDLELEQNEHCVVRVPIQPSLQ